MPSLPQQFTAPVYPRNWTTPRDVQFWGENLYRELTRQRVQDVHTINAMIKVGLSTERTPTPLLNEIFWYSTDLDQLYIAVDGVWTEADLGWVAALAGPGLIVKVNGTLAARTITAGDGIVVTNGDGVAGNPTIAQRAGGLIASRSSNQSIANATTTDVTLPTEVYDPDGGFTAGNAAYTIQRAGIHTIAAWGTWAAVGLTWDTLGVGYRGLSVVHNSTTVGQSSIPIGAVTDQITTAIVNAAVSDTLKLQVFQSSGAALNLTGCRFTITYDGPP